MKVYAALSSGEYLKALKDERYPWLLVSFMARGSWNLTPFEWDLDAMLLDSGAYTAWQTGREVDLAELIDWLNDYRTRDYLPPAIPIALDVMPGERGRMPTEAERQQGMIDSMANADTMREAGLPVMEVFHQYEPSGFLDQLLERRQPGEVLAISPRQGQGHHRRRNFCDGVWRHVRDRYGDEVPPLHGLGIGDVELALRYPWASVDASSYVAPGKFGRSPHRSGATIHDPRNTTGEREKPPWGYRAWQIRKILKGWREWAATAEVLWGERGVSWLD